MNQELPSQEREYGSGAREQREKPVENILHINVIRHGKALYGQREVDSVEKTNDLTPEAAAEIEENARQFAELIKDEDGEVEIWSSPYGRTLQTARIYKDALEEAGVSFHVNRKGKREIKVYKELDEHRNYPVEVVQALESGGEVNFQGETFYIDKKDTNPGDLDPVEYFFQHAIEKIPGEVKQKWPKAYQEAVEKLENVFQVTERMMRPLARLKKLEDKNYRVIIVTHNRLMGFLAHIFTDGAQKEVEPGEMISLKRTKGKLCISRMTSRNQGRSDVDVIEEFQRHRQQV